MKKDPFAVETVVLRRPLSLGERTVKELHFAPPKVKDLMAAGAYPEGSVAFTRAMLCSLTGEPESIVDQMIPEDWADCLVILNRAYYRFTGLVNLVDAKEEQENPTTAATAPRNSSTTSAA